MRKIIVIAAILFVMLGGFAIAQEARREYIGTTSGDQVIPEDLIENDQEFYYDSDTTNQYSPFIKRLGKERIRELIEEGLLTSQSFGHKSTFSPSAVQYPGGPATPSGPEYKPAAPKAP